MGPVLCQDVPDKKQGFDKRTLIFLRNIRNQGAVIFRTSGENTGEYVGTM